MTIKQTLIWSNKILSKLDPHYIEGEILFCFCLNKPREYLFTHPEQKLTGNQLINYKKLIARRLKKEPIAYLIKQKEFYGLNFYVDKNVLIPRPETELIVDEVLNLIKKLLSKDQRIANRESRITICDIGTGSGCIAIALAKNLPKAKIIATDISQKALSIAKKNAKFHKVSRQIKFIESDLLRNHESRITNYDIIVANLPYLTNKELKNVPHEPKTALYGGKDGLKYIKKLLSEIKKHLTSPGIILLEISPTQIKKIQASVKKNLPNKKVKIIKDLNKRGRVVKIY